MQVQPLFDQVLIKPLAQEQTTSSGIVIPDTAKEKPQQGKVIAVGPGALGKDGQRLPMEITIGQTVYYKKWGGNEIKIDGEEYLLVKQEDILAIIN
ncbi:co-chaperone GroES [candidate division WWE3 bacterium CG08_land_8_20_14_0_20_43_13]|uniref:Co-chaperonin GroES n=1 Tax=candidate division WWE3 bacterium CG08_land_8_20_14_0_20_43_13 TaxID=1975087 RepID=A0A2H0X7D2_UNCKA|nr:MAG: co-chaperone GroES [candidate division WWE3 bacterium CG08_land_8_20_14_0_20_43_13]